MIGQTVSHYKILKKLGEGGMGEVYLAEDTKLERQVALKFLPKEYTKNPEANERFKREAQVAAALNHSNIVTIYEINEHEDQTHIAMEYDAGQTLKEVMSVGTGRDLSLPVNRVTGVRAIRESPLQLDTVIDIAIQIAAGLSAAHAKGIVHRDIKPQNILINNEGRVKILDFGLAKLKGVSPLTKDSSTLGTLHYMSPEQTKGRDVDQRSDIWSLGVVLYEMLSERLPFKGDYDQAVAYSILNEDPKPLSSIRSEIPHELDTVIQKALAKNSEERYQQVADMEVDLKNLLKAITSPASNMRNFKTHDIPSIAVLPFKDMSPQQDQEYFCEGIAEELLNALVQIEGLRVAARTSASQFKDKAADVRAIGRQLNVKSVLEGSIRKAGDRLRITAQLINVEDGYHLFSEKYDRTAVDIFAIEDEISLAIVDRLKVRLLHGDRSKLTKRHTENEEAYRLYLQGRYFWNRRHEGGLQRGIEYFQKAIGLNPNYAAVHFFYGFCLTARGRFDEAIAEHIRAMELDPIQPSIRAAHAFTLWVAGRHDEAIANSRALTEFDPNFFLGWLLLGMSYAEVGMFADAEDAIRKADDLTGGTSTLILGHMGYVLALVGKRDEAHSILDRMLDLRRSKYVSAKHIASLYWLLDKHDEAFEWLEKGIEERDHWLCYAKYRSDPRFTALLKKAGLEK